MKKYLAILMAALLVLGGAAWAEVPDSAAEAVAVEAETGLPEDGGLPAPEEVEALTEAVAESEGIEVWFTEGFGLTLPDGWVSYPVAEEDQTAGVRYALGDGTGERFLYIQITPTQLTSAAALTEAVDNEDTLTRSGELNFGGTDFVAFIDNAHNASCCATLWGESLAMFIFTPQSDSGFMLTATQVMETFRTM